MQSAAGIQVSPQNTLLPSLFLWDHPDDWREFSLQVCSVFGFSNRPVTKMAIWYELWCEIPLWNGCLCEEFIEADRIRGSVDSMFTRYCSFDVGTTVLSPSKLVCWASYLFHLVSFHIHFSQAMTQAVRQSRIRGYFWRFFKSAD